MATIQDLESYVKEPLEDSSRKISLGIPGYVPRPPKPASQFDTGRDQAGGREYKIRISTWNKSRALQGMSEMPCGATKLLLRLLRAAWKTQSSPSSWCRAITTFTPKEKDSQNISKFRGTAQLNVEVKIFFTVVARHIASYFLANNYINTSCQKAVQRSVGCAEH